MVAPARGQEEQRLKRPKKKGKSNARYAIVAATPGRIRRYVLAGAGWLWKRGAFSCFSLGWDRAARRRPGVWPHRADHGLRHRPHLRLPPQSSRDLGTLRRWAAPRTRNPALLVGTSARRYRGRRPAGLYRQR